MNILIVDDSAAMRMIVKQTLRKAGFGGHDISECSDGAEALESILAQPPDLVLTDWNMPNMSGVELLEKLKEEGVKVPCGLVTTETTADMRVRAKEAGAKFVIGKPFTPESFEEHLGPFID